MSMRKSLRRAVKRRNQKVALRTKTPSERMLAETERSNNLKAWTQFTTAVVLTTLKNQRDPVE
jgi:hypothetical protein